ncbi:large ribosomal subunit protein uL10m [Neocloeon triangulifer]|uniref:large ribosomal subunit protein uL10m n=1 Tax=Neocloeon triangulifer TaxID=2078957 RepID=UPI00286F6597|nr:large ribosomal subunit protein uL10m [Neocloeon triangulifer]
MTSNILKRAMLLPWTPRVQFVRFKAKINIQNPAPPHPQKLIMLEFTKPIYPRPPPTVAEICQKNLDGRGEEDQIDNPYERILAKELMNWVEKSEFVALFQEISMDGETRYKEFAILKRKGIHIEKIGKQVATRAFKDTKYEVLLPLLVYHNSIAFAESPTAVATFMKLRKKIRHHILLAGIVENRFMTVAQLERFAALPDLTTARAQLVSVLNSAGSTLVSNLNTHQQTLVSNLESRIEQLKSV